MPEFIFEGTASWKSGTECNLTVKGKYIAKVSPPPEFGGKEGYCVPEEIFAASLASCMNTLFLLIARNSNLEFARAQKWARARIYGEEVSVKLRKHGVTTLQELGCEAIAPMLSRKRRYLSVTGLPPPGQKGMQPMHRGWEPLVSVMG